MPETAPKVFLSYRRGDTAFETAAIHRELASRFGSEQIFMDVDTIPAGQDFRQVLREAVVNCDVMVAVIGPNWVGAVDGGGERRLWKAADYVRLEIGAALERKIPVIPLLIGQTPLPQPDELPPELAELPYRHAMQIRAGRDFDGDLRRLVTEIQRTGRERARTSSTAAHDATVQPGPQHEQRSEPRLREEQRLILSLLAVVLVLEALRALGEGVYDYSLCAMQADIAWPTKHTVPMILCGLASGSAFGLAAWLMTLLPPTPWWRPVVSSLGGLSLLALLGLIVYDWVVAWLFESTDPPKLFGVSAAVALGVGMAVLLFGGGRVPLPGLLAICGVAMAGVYFVLAGLCGANDAVVMKLLPLDTALVITANLAAIGVLALFPPQLAGLTERFLRERKFLLASSWSLLAMRL